MKKVIKFLKEKLNDKDTVIACLSAGPDSMCLLHLLLSIPQNINIVCCHVNHKVRKESDEEAQYVRSLAKKHNLIYKEMTIDKYEEGNFEAEARAKRYTFFSELYNEYNAKYIITAHHGDDEIETVLMRLTRGSTLSGYAGIILESKKYLRPLLFVTKEDILKYNEENNIKYYIDATNFDDNHTRNRYRSYLLPFLKKENSQVHLKYLEFQKELTSYEKFVTDYIKDLQVINDGKLNLSLILKESEFIQKKAIEMLIKGVQKKYMFDVSNQNVVDIYNLIHNKKTNLKIALKNGFVAKKSYGFLEILLSKDTSGYNEVFSHNFQDNMFIIKEVLEAGNSNWEIRLDSSEINLPLIVRSKETGDTILLKNSGHKKVKDIFIDEKIDIDERKVWPLLVDSKGEILWIPGVKKSKFAKDKTEKYDIILSSERKGFNDK